MFSNGFLNFVHHLGIEWTVRGEGTRFGQVLSNVVDQWRLVVDHVLRLAHAHEGALLFVIILVLGRIEVRLPNMSIVLHVASSVQISTTIMEQTLMRTLPILASQKGQQIFAVHTIIGRKRVVCDGMNCGEDVHLRSGHVHFGVLHELAWPRDDTGHTNASLFTAVALATWKDSVEASLLTALIVNFFNVTSVITGEISHRFVFDIELFYRVEYAADCVV